jgi:hypothetical protein
MAELTIPDSTIGAAWHEFTYPRAVPSGPGPSFKRALRAAAPLIIAAYLDGLAEPGNQDVWLDPASMTYLAASRGLRRRASELRGEG